MPANVQALDPRGTSTNLSIHAEKLTFKRMTQGPQVLPGGDALLFTLASTSSSDPWDDAKIMVQSFKSGERHVLISGGSDARYLTGHIIYALSGRLLAVPFD